ncbi:hypothetical protein KALB_4917 [Kutzneria albida DSM 43870]|uniref:Uncharacterized protein n=1 Tax=Kutzneria albida DSM 43870 TaxID=1449976 RepID=W5WJE1_9PSEU|nr:hypothetical protein KALB_4917 [Kutzneria albida DSM 43870]
MAGRADRDRIDRGIRNAILAADWDKVISLAEEEQ